jgi:hypothetical protein
MSQVTPQHDCGDGGFVQPQYRGWDALWNLEFEVRKEQDRLERCFSNSGPIRYRSSQEADRKELWRRLVIPRMS